MRLKDLGLINPGFSIQIKEVHLVEFINPSIHPKPADSSRSFHAAWSYREVKEDNKDKIEHAERE